MSSSTMADVPERFVPDEMRGQLVEAEHMARYTWAAALCSGRRTLDVGCGVGYGAELLNRAGAAEVIAIDNSSTALDLARSVVSSGVTCELGDARDLPHPDGSFDLVVCFELIEHVDEQELVLDELARVLRRDGLLLISSPNRNRYMPGNPHHRHELVRAELQALLDARFSSARIVSQHVMLASVLSWSDAPSFDGAAVERMTAPEADDELYLVAMAGSELPSDPGPLVTLGLFTEPRAWLEYIDGQQHHIDNLTRHQRDLAGREADWLEALDRLAKAESELAELKAVRAELEANISDAESAHARVNDDAARRLSVVTTSRSWRLTSPLRRFGSALRRQ